MTAGLRRAWTTWSRWLGEPEDARPFALLRILTAATCFGVVALAMLEGIDVGLMLDEAHGGVSRTGTGRAWVQGIGGGSALVMRSLSAAALTLSVTLGLGWWSRLSAFLLGQVLIAWFGVALGSGGGHDRLITNVLWLLAIGPSGATWSVDAWIATGTWRPSVAVAAWARRLVVFQLIVMYTLTGLQKQGDVWGASGEYRAVYNALLMPTWQRFDNLWLGDVYPLLQLGTAVSWWWESLWVVLGVALVLRHPGVPSRWWSRWARWVDLRLPFVAVGLVLHGLLWVLLNVGPFTPITLACYVALFPGPAPCGERR